MFISKARRYFLAPLAIFCAAGSTTLVAEDCDPGWETNPTLACTGEAHVLPDMFPGLAVGSSGLHGGEYALAGSGPILVTTNPSGAQCPDMVICGGNHYTYREIDVDYAGNFMRNIDIRFDIDSTYRSNLDQAKIDAVHVLTMKFEVVDRPGVEPEMLVFFEPSARPGLLDIVVFRDDG